MSAEPLFNQGLHLSLDLHFKWRPPVVFTQTLDFDVSAADQKEFASIKNKVVDNHGQKFKTVHDYLVFRRSFASDDEWEKQAQEADREFDNNRRLFRNAMPAGSDEYLKELYHWVRNAYVRHGITDPVRVMRTGETTELHDAIAKVEETEGHLHRGGFNARPEKSAKAGRRFILGTLSEHATGNATDIEDEQNAFLSSSEWAYILKVTGKQVDRSRERWNKHPKELWKDIHDLSEAFAALDHDAEIKKLKKNKADNDLIELHEEWADGFFSLPESTVLALHEQGFDWGAIFSKQVDLHHFELKKKK